MFAHHLTIIALSFALLTPQGQQKPEALPLPAALKTARTAYLVNGGGAVAVASDKIMEQTLRDLRKWGRFELVADSEASDITITITTTPARSLFTDIPMYALVMTITSTSTKVPLYTVIYTGGPEGELKKLREALDTAK